MVTWARAKFSWSSFREVAGKKTMLSIVWMSSSCTTHLINKPANNLSEATYKRENNTTLHKNCSIINPIKFYFKHLFVIAEE